jgi:hypothetical protein
MYSAPIEQSAVKFKLSRAIVDAARFERTSTSGLLGCSAMAHSPHRTWKGCPLCKPHKRHGAGAAAKLGCRTFAA